MEPEGALRIFNRSVETNKLRYSEFYGDGNSKSYAAVKDVYEEDNVTVTKKECVGHVQKRVETALRKLKKDNKGLGGKGRLTDAMIDKLQNYYGIAIRTNCKDIDSMKKAIYAAFSIVLPQKRIIIIPIAQKVKVAGVELNGTRQMVQRSKNLVLDSLSLSLGMLNQSLIDLVSPICYNDAWMGKHRIRMNHSTP